MADTTVVAEATEQKVESKKVEQKVTVAYFCKALVMQGLSNEAIFAELPKAFPEQSFEGKRHYPGWYRNELRRTTDLDVPASAPATKKPSSKVQYTAEQVAEMAAVMGL